jgi:hypothetical protein
MNYDFYKCYILLSLLLVSAKTSENSLKYLEQQDIKIELENNDLTLTSQNYINSLSDVNKSFLGTDSNYIYYGTELDIKGLITKDDPSTLIGLKYKGTGKRTVFDRRKGWVNNQISYLVDASFSNGKNVELIFNEEYKDCQGISSLPCSNLEKWILDEAKIYAFILGQLPALIRKYINNLWIHKGYLLYGGGNNNIMIHLDQTKEYIKSGVLEQVILHEGTHNFDWLFGGPIKKDDWLKAAKADGKYISIYARDNPEREDVTETIVAYMAVKYRSNRFNAEEIKKIKEWIPNRIALLDKFDLRFP